MAIWICPDCGARFVAGGYCSNEVSKARCTSCGQSDFISVFPESHGVHTGCRGDILLQHVTCNARLFQENDLVAKAHNARAAHIAQVKRHNVSFQPTEPIQLISDKGSLILGLPWWIFLIMLIAIVAAIAIGIGVSSYYDLGPMPGVRPT